MAIQHFTLQGSEALIRQIAEIEHGEGVKVGRPYPADGFVDAADAPMGPDEIRQIIEIISISITTATAALEFVKKLKALVVKNKSPITVKHARTGRKLATIDESADVTEIASKLTDD